MMRQSSSRIQRSKKMKMKYALQLFVLLAISIWLLYQLKHTFNKRSTIDPKSSNSEEITNNKMDETNVQDGVVKLGRKHLPENVESKGDKYNQLDEEEEEEKDSELDQLLEDERSGEENGEDVRTGEEEFVENEEEGEEIQMDNKEDKEKEVSSSLELSNSSKNESSDGNLSLEDNSKGFSSNNQSVSSDNLSLEDNPKDFSSNNRSVSLEPSLKRENYNETQKLEPKSESLEFSIEAKSLQASNGTDSSINEASKME